MRFDIACSILKYSPEYYPSSDRNRINQPVARFDYTDEQRAQAEAVVLEWLRDSLLTVSDKTYSNNYPSKQLMNTVKNLMEQMVGTTEFHAEICRIFKELNALNWDDYFN
jgi:hypothetical protein